MPRCPILLAGTLLSAASPLAAQAGHVSRPAAVSLTAVRQPSISVGVAGPADDRATIAVWTAWNVDREGPAALALVASVDPPMLASARNAPGTGTVQIVGRSVSGAFVLFRQPIRPGEAVGARTEVLELRPGAGTLNLMVITQ